MAQAHSQAAAQVAAAAGPVQVLDPELHPPDVFLEPSQREEQVTFTEIPEAGVEEEVTGSELELHPFGNRHAHVDFPRKNRWIRSVGPMRAADVDPRGVRAT